jgi:hypothetical protein
MRATSTPGSHLGVGGDTRRQGYAIPGSHLGVGGRRGYAKTGIRDPRQTRLPELNSDYGVFTDFDADKTRLARSYAQTVIRTLLHAASDPVASDLRRKAQIGFYRERFSWPQRARE